MELLWMSSDVLKEAGVELIGIIADKKTEDIK